jgi:hypothetical protein
LVIHLNIVVNEVVMNRLSRKAMASWSEKFLEFFIHGIKNHPGRIKTIRSPKKYIIKLNKIMTDPLLAKCGTLNRTMVSRGQCCKAAIK